MNSFLNHVNRYLTDRYWVSLSLNRVEWYCFGDRRVIQSELLKEAPALPEEKYLTFILGSNVLRHPPPCVILISLFGVFVERSFHGVRTIWCLL